MTSVANYLPHHKPFGEPSLDRRASSPGRLRAPFLAHTRDLHAHARDTADPRRGYGISDLRDYSPPPFHGIDTPVQVSSAAPALPSSADLSASAGTSSRRRRRSVSPHLCPQRAAGISHPYHRPSPPSRSPHRERYQRARGESSRSRSPRFHRWSRLEDSREGSSSRRRRRFVSPHLCPQRAAGISHPYHRPSPPSRSVHRERYHRARGESNRSRSPPFHRSRLEDRREGSSSGSHGHEKRRGEGTVPYDAKWQTIAEPLCSSREHHRLDHHKRSFSLPHHLPTRKQSPVLVMTDKPLEVDDGNKSLTDCPPHHLPTRKQSPVLVMTDKPLEVDDGNTSPTDWPDSPIYCYQNYLKMISGHYGDDENKSCGADGNSEITGRVPEYKHEGRSYDGMVDDFMDAVVENWREPTKFDHEQYQKQNTELAELALRRYNKNKNNKVKFSLVEAVNGAMFSDDSYCYAHVNFYVKAKNGPNKNGAESLVFAELHHVGLRPNAMALTCFQLLDNQKQFPGCRTVVRDLCEDDDRDIYHCYACDDITKHPKGSFYKAGHFLPVSYYYED